jgi:hypothetical protein
MEREKNMKMLKISLLKSKKTLVSSEIMMNNYMILKTHAR